MRLYIAEKPSAAGDLAKHLGIVKKSPGFYECQGGNVVTHCVGHLFESAPPDYYSAELKKWSLQTLPIVPNDWKVLPKDKTKSQLKLIGELLRSAREVINFGDPDNEGQLLVDEVLEHFQFRGGVGRLWLQALDSDAINAGLKNLYDNGRGSVNGMTFRGMRDAARARSRADWLIGMNLSRAYTCAAQEGGIDTAVRTVGRVQTPTLALVEQRCAAVANFVSQPFFGVVINARAATGEFAMAWRYANTTKGLDADGRLLDKAIADAEVARVTDNVGQIVKCETKPRVVNHPRAFSLTSLTILASKMFGYKAAQVLASCQSLYETHKITSYPRTDCEYLPETQHADGPAILDALARNIPAMANAARAADPSIKSKTWNDAQLSAHHGIIPRPVVYDLSKLSEQDANVYQLIARAYIAQFFPVHQFEETRIEADFGGGTYSATGRVITAKGWKALYGQDEDKEAEDVVTLPAVRQGDQIQAASAKRVDKKTKAPTLFTEGTLTQAMENIHTALADDDERKVMADAEGIGTPATRSAIIEELKSRGFLSDQGKYIVTTPLASKFLAELPENVKSPSLAASWEMQLRKIERGELTLDDFVASQAAFVAKLVAEVKAAMPEQPVYKCPTCGAGELKRKSARGQFFWACNTFPACRSTFPDKNNGPMF